MLFQKGTGGIVSSRTCYLGFHTYQINTSVRSVQAFEQGLNLEALDVGLQSDCCAKSLRLCVHTQLVILHVLPRSNLVALPRGQGDWRRTHLW